MHTIQTVELEAKPFSRPPDERRPERPGMVLIVLLADAEPVGSLEVCYQ